MLMSSASLPYYDSCARKSVSSAHWMADTIPHKTVHGPWLKCTEVYEIENLVTRHWFSQMHKRFRIHASGAWPSFLDEHPIRAQQCAAIEGLSWTKRVKQHLAYIRKYIDGNKSVQQFKELLSIFTTLMELFELYLVIVPVQERHSDWWQNACFCSSVSFFQRRLESWSALCKKMMIMKMKMSRPQTWNKMKLGQDGAPRSIRVDNKCNNLRVASPLAVTDLLEGHDRESQRRVPAGLGKRFRTDCVSEQIARCRQTHPMLMSCDAAVTSISVATRANNMCRILVVAQHAYVLSSMNRVLVAGKVSLRRDWRCRRTSVSVGVSIHRMMWWRL